MNKQSKFNKISLKIISLLIVLSVAGSICLVQTSSAADGQLTNPVIGPLGDDPDAAKEGSLFIDYAVTLWNTAISLGALVVIAFYIMAAFEWITAGGESQKVETAQSRFKNATIGLILLVSSYVIVAFVGDLLFGDNFDLLDITLPIPD